MLGGEKGEERCRSTGETRAPDASTKLDCGPCNDREDCDDSDVAVRFAEVEGAPLPLLIALCFESAGAAAAEFMYGLMS